MGGCNFAAERRTGPQPASAIEACAGRARRSVVIRVVPVPHLMAEMGWTTTSEGGSVADNGNNSSSNPRWGSSHKGAQELVSLYSRGV